MITNHKQRAERMARSERFIALFNAMPGKNIDKIRQVAKLFGIAENTVRIYMLSNRERRRVPPERMMILLERELDQMGVQLPSSEDDLPISPEDEAAHQAAAQSVEVARSKRKQRLSRV